MKLGCFFLRGCFSYPTTTNILLGSRVINDMMMCMRTFGKAVVV